VKESEGLTDILEVKMKHINYKDVKAEVVKEEGARAAKIRWLITEKDGAKNFAMRLFEIEPDGYTPWHQHDWEHEVFILEGEGTARGKEGDFKFKEGDIFFVPPMEWHQFRNTAKRVLKVLCLIPYK